MAPHKTICEYNIHKYNNDNSHNDLIFVVYILLFITILLFNYIFIIHQWLRHIEINNLN